ncbi:hypothetical protein [Flaviaesturariibacter amylovorans]|uniref:Phage portal protein n=1 Tax=Flaviaesturariibacter amylovorans TaxID=1084520 RepID=A0ABP8GKX4_9BACT
MKNKNIHSMNFGSSSVPKPYESKNTSDDKYVTYGTSNTYPDFLLKLFNDCGTHASIIEGKSNYIIGEGLQYEDGTPVTIKINPAENIKELVMKCVKDFLVFNYFGIEVVRNVFGEIIELHHVPAHRIRTNKSKTKFWFSEDWSLGKKPVQYDRWKANDKDVKSTLFFYDGYFPSTQTTYTPPEYKGAIKSILTSIAIGDFNHNNITNHFSVSSLITFFQGSNVPEEVKQQILDDLKASYTGENGSKVIVDFQTPEGKSAEVKNLSSGDWANAYIEVGKKVSDDIFISHQITSPQLFGVKVPGELGGAELETSYEIFKATYVRVKRDALEQAFNTLFAEVPAITGTVSFTDKQLFKPVLADAMKQAVMTINEIRKEAGLPPIAGGDRFIGEPAAPVPDPVAEPMESEKKTSVVAADPKPTHRKLTEEDYEQVKDLGYSEDEFEIVEDFSKVFKFDKDADIANYLIEKDIKSLTVDQLRDLIAKDINVKVASGDLSDILNRLHESGVLKVNVGSGGKIEVKPNKTADLPDSGEVLVMYRYTKRPEVNGPDLLPTSRDFCVKMMNSKKLFSRENIQSMSQLFGYDVFGYSGGFKYDPVEDKTTPYCRHQWTALKVKRKSK